jgi:hypothetical protein
MTPSEIQEAYARANEVQNGFKHPTTRQARDVIALVKHISATQQTGSKPSGKAASNADIKDFFGGIFK